MCCTDKCCCITSTMISLVARKECGRSWGRSWGRKKKLYVLLWKKLKLDFNSFPCSLSGTPSSKLLPFLMRDPKLFLGQPPYVFLSIAIRYLSGVSSQLDELWTSLSKVFVRLHGQMFEPLQLASFDAEKQLFFQLYYLDVQNCLDVSFMFVFPQSYSKLMTIGKGLSDWAPSPQRSGTTNSSPLKWHHSALSFRNMAFPITAILMTLYIIPLE